MTTEASSKYLTDPYVVLSYGASGIGKTTDMGYSFPLALFLAAPGSLNSIETVCGYTPTRHEVSSIPEATEVIKMMKGSNFNTVVIDDFSFLAEQTLSLLEKTHKGFKLWGALRDVVIEFRNVSRYAGVNVVLNAWEGGPKQRENGQAIKGGPLLSGRLPEQIPALCDLVVRGIYEPSREPWPASYRCKLDPDWTMKDRFNIAYKIDPCPMNLAEILRASGIHVPRIWDDQEAQVVRLAAGNDETPAIFCGDPSKDREKANAAYRELMEMGFPVNKAKWTIRDALDRAVILRALHTDSMDFFVGPPKPKKL